jgi:hypothetical protein
MLGIWWLSNWWIALGVFCVGSLWVYFANVRRLHRQLETAFETINSHAKELSIRRKQLTVQQSYGLIDDSKWDAEMQLFMSRVIAPVAGRLEDPNNRQLVADAISSATQNFGASNTMFHPGMDPVQYEALVADLLRDLGWETRLTKGSGDQGIDVIADMRATKLVIQCKLYSSPVGNSAVQEAIAGMQFEDADYAVVVSNATFTQSARQLATAAGVFLLHHEQLDKLEENIFGTADWKLRSTSATAINPIVLPPAEPHSPRVLRDALIIIGGTVVVVVVVVVVTNLTRSPSESVASAMNRSSSVGQAGTVNSESGTVGLAAPVPRNRPLPKRDRPVRTDSAEMSALAATAPVSPEPDDVSLVSGVDSSAADHIAEYCRQVTMGNPTDESLCRTQEIKAWQRLVPGNEFPGLRQDIVEKCKQPPFPDSFVAKEACTKYALSDGLR